MWREGEREGEREREREGYLLHDGDSLQVVVVGR